MKYKPVEDGRHINGGSTCSYKECKKKNSILIGQCGLHAAAPRGKKYCCYPLSEETHVVLVERVIWAFEIHNINSPWLCRLRHGRPRAIVPIEMLRAAGMHQIQ